MEEADNRLKARKGSVIRTDTRHVVCRNSIVLMCRYKIKMFFSPFSVNRQNPSAAGERFHHINTMMSC